MAEIVQTFRAVARLIERHRGVILPAAVAAMILVILVPLPPMLIDILLTANITLAAIILLTTLYVSTPLDFGIFPSLLLVTTLFRLVLNVATTRLILTAGAGGRGVQEAQMAAGGVIWSFSEFVTTGSLAVGVILFAMLIVIQFVVITKGAVRISEVAARFVLDAMPGKQMAIDADLKASAINEAEARRRRNRIAHEADFYGAMDGASKFLRGDAIAAVIITFINILGGLYIGVVQYNWTWPQAVGLFTRLTIGDGLVTQIPAFLISVSAGLIVTRSTARTNLGEELIGQLTARPIVLVITGIFLAALMFTSLPFLPLLMFGAGCTGLAAILIKRRAAAAITKPTNTTSAPSQKVEELLNVDVMKVELGYALVRLVDSSRGGDLLERLTALRRQIAEELGLIVPPIHICDNLRLDARSYVVYIRGTKVAGDKLLPDRLLAIGIEDSDGSLTGHRTTEPAFSEPATWIEPDQQGHAEAMGCTVVAPAVVLMTHLGEIIRSHAPELLSRRQVVQLLENLRARADTLVEESLEKFGTARIQKVLQNLLSERAPIRDLEAILESLCGADVDTQDVDRLTEHVRASLWRALSQQYCSEDGKLWCVCLDSELEKQVGMYVGQSGKPAVANIPAELSHQITEAIQSGISRLKEDGHKPVVLCAPQVRPTVRELILAALPEAAVLGYNEVNCVEVQSIGSVGSK